MQLQLVHDLLEFYDKKSKPTWDNERAVNVTFSMDLYQILELVGVRNLPLYSGARLNKSSTQAGKINEASAIFTKIWGKAGL